MAIFSHGKAQYHEQRINLMNKPETGALYDITNYSIFQPIVPLLIQASG